MCKVGKHISVYFDREKLQFVGLKEAEMKQLKDTFQGVDVDFELKKMGLWLMSPKGKTRRGTMEFIVNWLKNSSPSKADVTEHESPLRPLLNDYLKDVWKGREHILEFNKIKKKS